jgi:hypothetical protein
MEDGRPVLQRCILVSFRNLFCSVFDGPVPDETAMHRVSSLNEQWGDASPGASMLLFISPVSSTLLHSTIQLWSSYSQKNHAGHQWGHQWGHQ